MESVDREWIMSRLTGRRGEQVDLARALGISTDKLNKILSGARRVQAAEVAAVLKFFGEGQPETLPAPQPSALVPVYNVQASAGHGALIDDESIITSLAFPPGYLQSLTNAPLRDLAIIGVKGDSMLPSLAAGDVVMLDRSKRDLSFDGLFVIRDNGDGLLIKRIGRAARKGFVMMLSDNRDLYPPIERAMADVEVVGKVVWTGRKV